MDKATKAPSDSNSPGPSPFAAPQISLPKGGGAIRGIGEKFAANPVTGTGSMTVPIATSPGRAGFGPQLSISYDSGAGNGPFGIGWNLSLPAITRKTDKGLPRYRDAEESDVFILSGAEDLVPIFKINPDGTRVDQHGNPVFDEEQRNSYSVKRYRPRIEGLFARIERWTRISDGDTHWRSISKDNILTVYGSTPESRIADPADPGLVFSWLICQSYDDKGNAIVYRYVGENDDNVDVSRINERSRVRTANRYLKYIQYGNRQPLLIDPTQPGFRQPHVPEPDFGAANWMFEVVFDYGEGHYQEAQPDANGRTFSAATLKPLPNGTWPVREDPYSIHRSCFEVRCYRLCQRALLFHHFPDELGVEDYLVRSTEFNYNQNPNGSFISQVVQSGFKRIAAATPPYLKRSLPPLEFEYSISPFDDLTFDQLPVQEVDPTSLENLPSGIEANRYRWIDLDGEGISGVLTEEADAWLYKRNLGGGRFGPSESVSPRPSLAALNSGRQQFLDLAGDGNLDLVDFASMTQGYFSRADDATWDRFRTFTALPKIDWQDPNLRFFDLTGDGHADVLLTEDQAFSTWFESLAEQGFGAGNRVIHPLQEEDGPRLVFADGTQSVYVADMSGDGLSDLVRVRNGEVCYWPNMGYGRFGPKVTLNNAPWFDGAESFDQRRVHLTDTDGSGPTDIIYLGRDGVRVYLNQHGNSLSDARLLDRVPKTDNHTSVSVVDFLGRGTACLLWSSPLPADAGRPLRYLDLMGGIKPHLLKLVRNNLGSETRLEYKSSTESYLADKAAGTPWITRLPFPVHVVTRVETNDLISGNRFATTYTYHHGYFDGVEREFRGFGRVEQCDTEEFGALAPATNLDQAFHVPPALIKTWFHTGAYFPIGERVSRHFADEYYREEGLTRAQLEVMLLADTVLPEDLADSERREAVRSLKGGILRQEIYALDDKPESTRPYSVSERNYMIKSLQPQASNRHSVFFTHEQETIEFHYERKAFPVSGGKIVDASQVPGATLQTDPRVSHTANLAVDDYGNILKSIVIGYGRRFDDPDPVLSLSDRKKQKQLSLTLTEASFTNVVTDADAYRAPLPAETTTYELVKLTPSFQLPGITNLFLFDELIGAVAKAGDGAHDLAYDDVTATGATSSAPYRRPIERMRTRYRSNNFAQLLPLATVQALAVPGESYKLAFTPGLLSAVYQRPHQGQPVETLLPNPGAVLRADAATWADRGGYVDLDGDGNWWIPSGRVFYHPDPNSSATTELNEAVGHFFLQRRFRDPFAHDTVIEYANDLLPVKTTDPLGSTMEVIQDFRVLQPKQLTDPNGNRSFVVFDAIGLPVASALRGKPSETLGDSVDDFGDFDADPTLAQLQTFVAGPQIQAPALLKSATNRFVYDLDRFKRCGEPPFAAVLARETHVSDLVSPQGLKIQVSFMYSDGVGREVQSKIPAEPGDGAVRVANTPISGGDIKPGLLVLDGSGAPTLGNINPRWVGKGRTVYNNKGKPVKQYEPFFSSTHLYESEPEMTDTGVTAILFYDPVDRVVATLHPNHTYEKVTFDPWRQETWDVNDTVTQADPRADADVGEFFALLPAAGYLPTWHEQRRNGQKGPDEKNAAEKAAAHAGTPTVAHFDALGRPTLTVVDNGVDTNGVPQKYVTRVNLDIEGNQRKVIDAKNRVVMHYDYDMLGNRIAQASMEAGQRWMLKDVTGKPIRSWDSRDHAFRIEYDELRRPAHSFATGADPNNLGTETCFQIVLYGEAAGTGLTPAQALQANVRGKAYKHFDTAGVSTSASYDFKGNLLGSTRQLVQDYKTPPDWSKTPALETEIFSSSIMYDALDRPVQFTAPLSDKAGSKLNLVQPAYNEANLLERIDVWVALAASPSALLGAATANFLAVTNIDYNAKGQRTRIDYGNGASTGYSYDAQTFRLVQLKTSNTNTADTGFLSRLLGRSGAQSTSVFQNLFYTFDPVGNITHIRDDAQQTIYFKNQVVLPSCDYVYDPTYRLTQAIGREHIGQLAQPQTNWDDEFRTNLPHPCDGAAMRSYTDQYFYDAVGNFERMVHQAASGNWTRTYSYNEASLIDASKNSNRLSSTAVGSTTEPYTYDSHGNMTGIPHLTLMEWDFKDQLRATSRQAVNPTPPPNNVPSTTFYVYDGSGQRVRKVTERQNGSREAERIYLGAFEIYREFSADGNDIALERETLHVMDDKQRIAIVETRTQGTDGSPLQLIRYQFGNHLGSASLELDDKCAIISYEEYFPYGSTSYQAMDQTIKAAAKRYRYTGKERDEETGFTYHGARYYAPWLGRWTSCDPILQKDFNSQRHSYAYVDNRPIVAFDPDGRELVAAGIGILVGAAVGVAVEGGRQLYTTGTINNPRAVAAAAAGGALAGGIIGLTSGGSLLAQAAGAGLSGAAGGVETRAVSGQPQTAEAVAQDAAVAMLAFGVVEGGQSVIQSVKSAITSQSARTVENQAIADAANTTKREAVQPQAPVVEAVPPAKSVPPAEPASVDPGAPAPVAEPVTPSGPSPTAPDPSTPPGPPAQGVPQLRDSKTGKFARDPNKAIKPSNITSAGVERRNRASWREWRDSWDKAGMQDILSKGNRDLISKGLVPQVDDAWLTYFPDATPGEAISIHHIQGTSITVPLTESQHIDAHNGDWRKPGGPGQAR